MSIRVVGKWEPMTEVPDNMWPWSTVWGVNTGIREFVLRIVFKDGKPVEMFEGESPPKELREAIKFACREIMDGNMEAGEIIKIMVENQEVRLSIYHVFGEW